MAFTTSNSEHLIRSEVWSRDLKERFQDELQAEPLVHWLQDFPDGEEFTIPSVGGATVRPYTDDTPIVYDKFDTGEFKFQITEYESSATYITNKSKQDLFYMSRLISKFVPEQHRALMESLESKIFGLASQQTASAANNINGAAHRFVATGGADGARQLAAEDFAAAKFSLKRAKVPLTNLVAFVDAAAAYHLETATNLVNVSNNPQWEGIIETGLTSGMRFIRNIYGFDVYETNYLAAGAASESIDAGGGARTVSAANSVQNCFMSLAGGDSGPFVGAWRQEPTVESEYNKDMQREEYLTIARYGLKLYRPENLVVILSDDDTVTV